MPTTASGSPICSRNTWSRRPRSTLLGPSSGFGFRFQSIFENSQPPIVWGPDTPHTFELITRRWQAPREPDPPGPLKRYGTISPAAPPYTYQAPRRSAREIDTAEVGITPPVPPVTFRTPAISVSVTCQPDARGSVSPGTGSAYCLSPEGVNATPLAMWVVGCAVSAGLTQTSSTSPRLPRWSVAQDALANALGLIANPEYGDTDVRLDVR